MNVCGVEIPNSVFLLLSRQRKWKYRVIGFDSHPIEDVQEEFEKYGES